MKRHLPNVSSRERLPYLSRGEERDYVGTAQQFDSYGSSGGSISEHLHTFRRNRRLILSLALVGVGLAFLLHLTTQPVYRTRTSIDIETVNGDFMNMRSVDPTAATSSSELNIQTQIKLLQSDALVERVEERLTREPHPISVPRNDLLSRVARTLHIGGPSTIPFGVLVDETARGIKVKPLGITRLVELTCDSWDPAFAATFCNTLITEFQAQDLEERGSEAKHTSDWLMHQAADIRQKAEDSQARLFAATGGNGLILSQESNTVGEDRLRQMQAELVKAQADRMEKQAQTVVAKTSALDSTPNIVDSPGYAAARIRLGDLQNQVAAIVPPLTEENPRVIRLRAEIKQVQESMVAQGAASSQRLENEYTAAKHREDLLRVAYRTQEAGVSSDLEKGSQVALLRREVESEQQLYQTLMQRAKEAGFASAMQASTVRVVDEAKKPKLALYPQRFTAAGVGLLLGLLIGAVIATFKDRRSAVLRNPGDIQKLLQVEELGVIPTSALSNRHTSAAQNELVHASEFPLALPLEHPALEIAGWDNKFSLVAEAYRNATLSILLSGDRGKPGIYVISSPNSGEGKTTVTTNLGVALSRSKLRVLLIDGDLRMPSLHKTMSVSNLVGLRDVLRGNVIAGKFICQPTAFPNLYVLPAGTGSEEVVELLHSSHLASCLEGLSEEFDVILIDTPPISHMVDARLLAAYATGVILILRSGVTTRKQALTARDTLDHDQVRIVGSLLNDFNPSKEGQADYYKSYYMYQQPRATDAPLVGKR